jgi:hypothetical protein
VCRELCGKQLEQALQPSSISCADLQRDVADLAATHKELLAETQEQQMQLLGQVRRTAAFACPDSSSATRTLEVVLLCAFLMHMPARSPSTVQVQDLCSLVKRAICMGTSDLLPAEAAALASLLQELHWLQQDTRQQDAELAAAAQQLICELAAAVPGSAGASAGMLDCALARRASSTAAAAAASGTAAAAGAACSDASLRKPGAPAVSELHAQADAGVQAACEDSDLQLLFTQHPLAPTTLQQQLQVAYAERLQQHRQQLQDNSAQQGMHAGQCRNWTPDQHALFTFFRAQAMQGLTRSDTATQAAAAASSVAGCGMSGGRSRGAGGSGRLYVAFKASSSSSSSSSSTGRGPQGCSKASVLDFLAVRMPGKTKQQLAEHDAW